MCLVIVLEQVLPDLRFEADTEQNNRDPAWSALVQHVLASNKDKVGKRRRKDMVPNMHAIRGLEHSLQLMTGMDLGAFVPGTQLEPVNGEWKAYSVPATQLQKKSIPLAQGSIGWYGLQWLFNHMGVFGSFRGDPHHRLWNNTSTAVRVGGFEMAMLACKTLWNTCHGPWMQKALHPKKKPRNCLGHPARRAAISVTSSEGKLDIGSCNLCRMIADV